MKRATDGFNKIRNEKATPKGNCNENNLRMFATKREPQRKNLSNYSGNRPDASLFEQIRCTKESSSSHKGVRTVNSYKFKNLAILTKFL
jgi:hypothetical protein